MEADLDRDGKISFEEFTKMVENTDVSTNMTLGMKHWTALLPITNMYSWRYFLKSWIPPSQPERRSEAIIASPSSYATTMYLPMIVELLYECQLILHFGYVSGDFFALVLHNHD
jgi:hypothetical protein